MATGNEPVKASGVRALWNHLWGGGTLKELRREMGLGDTLGVLPPECGGTGSTSLAAAGVALTGTASIDPTPSNGYAFPVIELYPPDGTSVMDFRKIDVSLVYWFGSGSSSRPYSTNSYSASFSFDPQVVDKYAGPTVLVDFDGVTNKGGSREMGTYCEVIELDDDHTKILTRNLNKISNSSYLETLQTSITAVFFR